MNTFVPCCHLSSTSIFLTILHSEFRSATHPILAQILASDASMKRQQIVPSAPPPEAYYLPAPPLPRRPPPRWPGPSDPQPRKSWQPPPRSVTPPHLRSHAEPQELNYEEINDKTPKNPEKPSRFNVKPGKHKKKINPQLHTERC